MSARPAPPLRAVVGEGVRRFRDREGVTADDVARVAREHGLQWTQSTVSALERGNKAVSAGELAALAHVLSEVGSQPVRLRDLVDGDGWVALTVSLSVPREELAELLSGGVAKPRRGRPAKVDAPGIAEERAARRLGSWAGAVAESAVRLWGHTLTVERDRRAGPGANPQRRGQVTRTLLAELERAM